MRAKFDADFGALKIDKVTPATKYRTYALSLEVLRADQYRVDRPDGNVDIYLPVSLRLYVTNLLSGEVLFSRAVTTYHNLRETQADVSSGAANAHIDAAYRDNLMGLIDKVMDDTQAQFHPLQVSAAIVANPFGLFVINRGIDAGIAKGTELVNALGAGIRILYSGKSYAVGEPTLGDLHDGETLSMYSTAAAADIVKPRTLIMDADAPSDLPGAYAAQQFAENLGSRAAFTVVAVNPDFQDVLQAVAATDGVQQSEVTQRRVPPDYFVRIKIPEPVVYTLPTSKGFGKLRVLSGTAWAELLDGQGRVVYVTQVNETIQDTILDGGIAFDSADRRKVIYGNLLKSLSEQFIKNVRFRQDSLTVTEVTDGLAHVADPQATLHQGQEIRLFRPSAIRQIGADPVMLPLWDMRVESVGGMATLSGQLPVTAAAEKIQAGDVVLLQGTGQSNDQTRSATLCPTILDKGAITLGDVRSDSYFAFASGSRLPFLGGDVSLSDKFSTLSAERELLKNAGFSRPIKDASFPANFCYQPLVKVDELSRQCDDGAETCDVTIKVIGGVNLLDEGKASGNRIEMSQSELKGVPKMDADAYIKDQAAKKLAILLEDSVRQLPLPAASIHSQPTTQGN